MKDQAGSRHVANAIWTIGLPRRLSFAAELRGKQLSEQDLEAVPEAIHNVLNWLDHLASTLTEHWQRKEYQHAVLTSGFAYGQSGLTAAEQKTRAAIRKA